jgi:DNA polymerase-3 subunit epsilon
LFAIVDVETTGGHAAAHGMTELAIVQHDGQQAGAVYRTLLRPERPIPPGIQALTGITDAMVAEAPRFEEVAEEVRAFLGDRIFVAHNVQFDYSFMKAAFAGVGLSYAPRRLCTVRLARRVLPGQRSYSLGRLCGALGIQNEAAHRAWGDAQATAELLTYLLDQDTGGQWQYLLKTHTGELNLPPHLPAEDFRQLPETPGVYFLDGPRRGQPLYIGKARNLKKRVSSHFNGAKESRRTQQFFRQIHGIRYQPTGSSLLAALLEDHAIRRHWPPHNRAQKRPVRRYGVFRFVNRRGLPCLAINRIQHAQQGFLADFYQRAEAEQWLLATVRKWGLDPGLCGLPPGVHADLPRPTSQAHVQAFAALEEELARRQDCYQLDLPAWRPHARVALYLQGGQPLGFRLAPNEGPPGKWHALSASVTCRLLLRKALEEGTYPGRAISAAAMEPPAPAGQLL